MQAYRASGSETSDRVNNSGVTDGMTRRLPQSFQASRSITSKGTCIPSSWVVSLRLHRRLHEGARHLHDGSQLESHLHRHVAQVLRADTLAAFAALAAAFAAAFATTAKVGADEALRRDLQILGAHLFHSL